VVVARNNINEGAFYFVYELRFNSSFSFDLIVRVRSIVRVALTSMCAAAMPW